jgi:hypothetical protein
LGNNGTLKTTLMTLWLMAVAGVVAGLYFQDRFFAIDIKAIATLDKKTGPVQARSEGLVRWRDVAEDQGLFDGDRVATGRSGRSTIGFGPGRQLNMGEDTQVQIRAILQGNGDYAFMITLVRGTVVANIDESCTGCPPLILRAGDETFNLASGDRLGVFKAIGKRATKFDPNGPWPMLRRPRAVSPPPPKPEEPPPPPPKKKEKPLPQLSKPIGLEIDIAQPTGKEWWTMQPIASLSPTILDIPLKAPAQKPEVGEWKPLVEVSGSGKPLVIDTLRPTDRTLRLSVGQARKVAVVKRQGGVTEYGFSLRGGAAVTRGKDGEQSFSSRKVDYKIKTLGEFPGGPVSIGVDQINPQASNSPWMEPKKEVGLDASNLIIHLTSSQDYSRFYSLIRGSGSVAITREGLRSASGVFVVRKQAVVAQLRGPALTKPVASKMLDTLQGDFVFKGPRSALHDTRGQAQGALVDWIGALLDKGKVLYILKRNKLYPVSRDFIKTNNEVAQFIDSQAKAIFLEKVQILDYR